MKIRVGMTGGALGRQPCKLTGCMAIFTKHFKVRPGQREVAQVVIEGGFFPVNRGVAGSTIRAEASVMLIVLAMAGITVSGRALENVVLVTPFTTHPGMFAFQLES